jgi:PTS system nitrogen regulatory IIA component
MQLTVRDAARLLDAPEERIYRWIEDGAIPVYRVNEQYRFNRAELLEWATSRGMQVSVEIFRPPRSSSLPISLHEALAAGGVHTIAGRDRSEVIRSAVGVLDIADERDREMLISILLAREAAKSTVGDGIAIPHVRNPIVLRGCRPKIALCFLETPLDLGAVDGKPVTTLFMMMSPTPKLHLHLLSCLSSALHDSGFKDALVKRAPADVILKEARRVEGAFPV